MGQLLVEGGEADRNLTRAEEMIRQAARQSCDLILLPECLDLAWTHPSALTEAQPIPGPFSDRLCSAAQAHQITLCAGLTEKCRNKIYNSAILVNPNGEIILKYRKINELSCAHHIYSIGDSLSVAETPFGIIGVNICSDNYLNALDIGHTLARMGAQLILSPSSWTVDYSEVENNTPYKEKWLTPYLTLARLYDLVIISATSVGVIVGGIYEGKKMVGCSLAVGKEGILAQGSYNEFAGELIVADIAIPSPHVIGTNIGSLLKQRGYFKNTIVPDRIETPPQRL